MATNNIVTRPDAQALMPEQVANDMLQRATQQSAVLTMFRRIPVSRAQVRLPILSALPLAYWVAGDTGQKQTSEVNWSNKYLNIEECAVIMPVPDSVIADAEQNIWDESLPLITEAVGRLVDATVFFGTNAPASFPTNISSAASSAGNTTTESAAPAAGAFFGDFDVALGKLEDDGFEMDGVVAATSMKSRLRAARSTQGEKLDENRVGADLKSIDGTPVMYSMRGLFPAGLGAGSNVRAFVGDYSQFVLGVRSDITVDMFREGVIQDNTGAIVFNLMQQDLKAMRITMRLGWQVSNLINYDQPIEANRYPVSRIMY